MNQKVEDLIVDVYNKRTIKTGICGCLTASGNRSFTACGTFMVFKKLEESKPDKGEKDEKHN